MSDNMLDLEGFSEKLKLSQSLCLDNEAKVDPANLEKYIKPGRGLNNFESRVGNFFLTDSSDITFLQFSGNTRFEDFTAFMHITDLQSKHQLKPIRQYAAFYQETDCTHTWFLSQLRIVTCFALKNLFGLLSPLECKTYPEQTLTMREAIWGFMQSERSKYSTKLGSQTISNLQKSEHDDFQKFNKELGFGFMVEDSHHGVYRIWSKINKARN